MVRGPYLKQYIKRYKNSEDRWASDIENDSLVKVIIRH